MFGDLAVAGTREHRARGSDPQHPFVILEQVANRRAPKRTAFGHRHAARAIDARQAAAGAHPDLAVAILLQGPHAIGRQAVADAQGAHQPVAPFDQAISGADPGGAVAVQQQARHPCVGERHAHPALPVPPCHLAFGGNPQAALAIGLERRYHAVRQAVAEVLERKHAVAIPRQTGAGANPQGAVGILMKRRDPVGGKTRGVGDVEGREGDAIEADQAGIGRADPQVAVAGLQERPHHVLRQAIPGGPDLQGIAGGRGARRLRL